MSTVFTYSVNTATILSKLKLQGCYYCPRIAFHRASEHQVVVAGIQGEKDLLHVDIYTPRMASLYAALKSMKKGLVTYKG